MAIRRLVFILTVLFTSMASAPAVAITDQQINSLRLLVGDICKEIPSSGSRQQLELSGELQLKLLAFLKRLGAAGIDGSGKLRIEEWQGVLQTEVATLLKGEQECRLRVFDRFMQTLEKTSEDTSQDVPSIVVWSTGYINDDVIKILNKRDGQLIYLDSIDQSLVTKYNHDVEEKCSWDIDPAAARFHRANPHSRETSLAGAKVPLPNTKDERNGGSCLTFLRFSPSHRTLYPTSAGGTGLHTILVREYFLVNRTGSGAETTFYLRPY